MTRIPPDPHFIDSVDEPDFTFTDVVEHVSAYWRWLIIGPVLGAIIGLAWAYTTLTYRAETVVGFVESDMAVRPWELKDYLQIRAILSESASVNGDQPGLACLLNEDCWRDSVRPFYALSGLEDPFSSPQAKALSPTDTEGRKRLAEVIGVALLGIGPQADRAVEKRKSVQNVILGGMRVLLFEICQAKLGGILDELENQLNVQLIKNTEESFAVSINKIINEKKLEQLPVVEKVMSGLSDKMGVRRLKVLEKELELAINPVRNSIDIDNKSKKLNNNPFDGENKLIFSLGGLDGKTVGQEDSLTEKIFELSVEKVSLEAKGSSLMRESSFLEKNLQMVKELRRAFLLDLEGAVDFRRFQEAVGEFQVKSNSNDMFSYTTLNNFQNLLKSFDKQNQLTNRVLLDGLVRQSKFMAAMVTGLLSGMVLSLLASLFMAKWAAYRASHVADHAA